jgi:hypothetical protein
MGSAMDDPDPVTPERRRGWIIEGLRRGATHVIVVTDTFDYSDYPVYVQPEEDFATIRAKYNGQNMQRVMESFDLTEDLVKRLA